MLWENSLLSLTFFCRSRVWLKGPFSLTPQKPSFQKPMILHSHQAASLHPTNMQQSLSSVKSTNYFEGELTDGKGIIRVVGFDRVKQQKLQYFCDYNIPVTLYNCHVQQSKYKNCLEVKLKDNTKIEASDTQFHVPDLKTVGSTMVGLNQINKITEHDRVTVRVCVMKVHDMETLPSGKKKNKKWSWLTLLGGEL